MVTNVQGILVPRTLGTRMTYKAGLSRTNEGFVAFQKPYAAWLFIVRSSNYSPQIPDFFETQQNERSSFG